MTVVRERVMWLGSADWMCVARRMGLSIALGWMPAAAVAQDTPSSWPSRPIRIILPSAAGGAGDVTSRLLAQKLTERLGQQVFVENRPGGAGVVGSAAIARAEPDGYTIGLLTASTHAASPALTPDIPYKAESDFAPIAMFANLPIVVAAYPGLPVKNITDLVSLAKAKPDTITNGWAATLPYLSALLFESRAGIKLNHIPYKGSGQAAMDLIEGRINIQFGTISSILALLREHKLKALAITSGQRTGALPDTPTIAETVLPGYDSSLWMGYGAPAGTPEPIIRRMNREIVAILRDPEMHRAFADNGVDVLPSTPEELGARIKEDVSAYKEVVARAGITVR